MAKIAFLFPGQGSQRVGMGRAAFEHSPAARQVFEQADQALDFALSELCFEGPEDQLGLTMHTQPAILTTSVALLRGLEAALGVSAASLCDAAAGHSLGEYSAQVAAGAVAFSDAVRLVRVRGGLMQDAVPVGEGAMAAVMGCTHEQVEAVCSNTDGAVEPANYNAPGQLVIAGSKSAVEAASSALKDAGAKVIPLSVSAPFHSSLMRPAEHGLRPHLEGTAFRDLEFPVYTNVDASPVLAAGPARDSLARQVSRPVRWEQTIRRMATDGVGLFVEIGHGRVLAGLMRRIDPSLRVVGVAGPDDFTAAATAMDEVRSG